MALNFKDAAAKKVSEIERPPLPPIGTYRFKIMKLPEVKATGNGEWEIMSIPSRAVEALEDVDLDGYKGKVTDIVLTHKFMFDVNDEVAFETSMFRATNFFDKHVKCADPDDSIAQMLNNSVGQEYLGTVVWQEDKKEPGLFHANIGRTACLD